MNKYDRRAERGARWLDRVHGGPGWADLISPGTLDLFSTRECVLGQVFAGQARRAGAKSGFDWAMRRYWSGPFWSIRHGFDSFFGRRKQEQAWLRLLAPRVEALREQRHSVRVSNPERPLVGGRA